MRRTIAGLVAALVLTTGTLPPAHAETTTPPTETASGSALGGDGLAEAVGIVTATGLAAGGLWWLTQQPHIKQMLQATFPNTVYYENCEAVRAAGLTLIYPQDPGYRAGLDKDNDGIGCEHNE